MDESPDDAGAMTCPDAFPQLGAAPDGGRSTSISQYQFGRLLAVSPMAAMVVDRHLRARWANDACVDMLGYSVAEMPALRSGELVHPDSRSDRDLAEVWLRVGAVEALTANCRLICSDGSTVFATIHTSVLPDDDHDLVLLLIEDRTDQYWVNPDDFGAPVGRADR